MFTSRKSDINWDMSKLWNGAQDRGNSRQRRGSRFAPLFRDLLKACCNANRSEVAGGSGYIPLHEWQYERVYS